MDTESDTRNTSHSCANPACPLRQPFGPALVAEIDRLEAAPGFDADLDDGYTYCEALQMAQRQGVNA